MTKSPHKHSHGTHPPREAAPLPPDRELQDASVLFSALADPERLRLLLVLADGERCVSELCNTSAKLTTVSARLKTLTAARLVRRRREARHIYYTLADDHITELLHAVLAHVKEPHPR